VLTYNKCANIANIILDGANKKVKGLARFFLTEKILRYLEAPH